MEISGKKRLKEARRNGQIPRLIIFRKICESPIFFLISIVIEGIFRYDRDKRRIIYYIVNEIRSEKRRQNVMKRTQKAGITLAALVIACVGIAGGIYLHKQNSDLAEAKNENTLSKAIAPASSYN